MRRPGDLRSRELRAFRPFPGNVGANAAPPRCGRAFPRPIPPALPFEGCDHAGLVTELLGFLIATLASLPKILDEGGVVSPDAHSGLRLTDLAGLEKLART